MKRYEGCNGVGGWFISHLGWFIVVVVVFVLMLVAVKCHAQKSDEINKWQFNANIHQVNNVNNNVTAKPCGPILLPNELYGRKIIKNMRVGDKRFAGCTVMDVDEDGKCYIHTYLTFEEKQELGRYWIGIERVPEGYYVTVRIEDGEPKWEARRIVFKKDLIKAGDLFPVCKITVVKKHFLFGAGVGGTAELLKNHK